MRLSLPGTCGTRLWFFLVVVRFIWTLWPQNGYIHPDEFFQTTEIAAGDVFNLTVLRTWEFTSSSPLRSIVPIYLVYAPPLLLLKLLALILGRRIITSYTLLVVSRLSVTLLSLCVDFCVYNLAASLGFDGIRSAILLASSSVTLVYYTRTFSNTTEAFLFTVLLWFAMRMPPQLLLLKKEPKRLKPTASSSKKFAPHEVCSELRVGVTEDSPVASKRMYRLLTDVHAKEPRKKQRKLLHTRIVGTLNMIPRSSSSSRFRPPPTVDAGEASEDDSASIQSSVPSRTGLVDGVITSKRLEPSYTSSFNTIRSIRPLNNKNTGVVYIKSSRMPVGKSISDLLGRNNNANNANEQVSEDNRSESRKDAATTYSDTGQTEGIHNGNNSNNESLDSNYDSADSGGRSGSSSDSETTNDQAQLNTNENNSRERKSSKKHSVPACDVYFPPELSIPLESSAISAMLVVGIFNRPTFLFFAFVPVLYWLLKELLLYGTSQESWLCIARKLVSVGLFSLGLTLLFTVCDSIYYGHLVLSLDKIAIGIMKRGFTGFICTNFTLVPLNFALYNIGSDNLAEHGIHPRITHVCVNAPLLFGLMSLSAVCDVYRVLKRFVALRFMLFRKRATTLLAAYIVPLLLLSAFPHQEPRFLIPLLVPLVVLYAESVFSRRSLVYLSIFLNVIACVFFGCLHQGGVVQAIAHIQRLHASSPKSVASVVFWRTYMPARHLFVRYADEYDVHDLAGCSKNEMELFVTKLYRSENREGDIFFIAPGSIHEELKFLNETNSKFRLNRVKSFFPHLSTEDLPDLGKDLSTCSSATLMERYGEVLSLAMYRVYYVFGRCRHRRCTPV